jgi:hypothetical protein
MDRSPINRDIPLDLLVTDIQIWHSNLRAKVRRPWTLDLSYSFQSLRQPRSKTPCSIKLASICLISARTLRPISARFLAASRFSFVNFPCVVCKAAILSRPAWVRGPVLLPPCRVHRPVRFTAGRLHLPPALVLAPQRTPGQSGPKRVSRPILTLPFAIILNTPIRVLYYNIFSTAVREGTLSGNLTYSITASWRISGLVLK